MKYPTPKSSESSELRTPQAMREGPPICCANSLSTRSADGADVLQLEEALTRLGYSLQQVAKIKAYIDENKTIVGAPGLHPMHTAVFACSGASAGRSGASSAWIEPGISPVSATSTKISGSSGIEG